ncbi:MAG: hypothetical protein ACXU9K_07105, partial [Thermodesulfobacteriota bacterium]
MKDYVLRIYRREKKDPRILVGVVEEVGVEGNKAFSNLDELWSILNSSRAETAKTKKRDKLYATGTHPPKMKISPRTS